MAKFKRAVKQCEGPPVSVGFKVCRDCGEHLWIQDFTTTPWTKDGRGKFCFVWDLPWAVPSSTEVVARAMRVWVAPVIVYSLLSAVQGHSA